MKKPLCITLFWLLTAGIPVAKAAGIPASRQLALHSPLPRWNLAQHAVAFYKRVTYAPAATALSRYRTAYFADKYSTAFTPHNAGVWTTTATGGRIWRLALTSAGAYSLYATLQKVQLAPGVQLFVYNPAYRQVHGPYTSGALQSSTTLSIPPVAGNTLVLELNLPAGITHYGSLKVAAVYHDKMNLFGYTTAPPDCEQPINCTNGAYWQTEKRAVCKIIADGALCTGTLLANTSRNSTPYVLTAWHVIFTQQHAQEAMFLFNYEYTTCGGNETATAPSVSGSTLVATQEGTDAVLLQLNMPPPASCKPYYAGWDVSDNAPAVPAATIHHPWGHPKQIALTWQDVTDSDYGSNYTLNAFWKCSWDIGITQPGSSGAPLFNQQHRVVGTLTGGDATCGAGGSDYFYKLEAAWKTGSITTSHLATWLDAARTGVTAMDGYDPYGLDSSACSEAWNILPFEKVDSTPLINLRTGMAYPVATPLAEQFLSPGALLVSAVYLNIAALYSADTSDAITLKVWEGDATPGREVYTQNISLAQLRTGKQTITTDSAISLRGNFFVGYVPHLHPASRFTLYHAASRGRNGVATLYVADAGWHALQQLNAGMTTSAGIGIKECYGNTRRPVYGVIRLFPNPCNRYLHFTLPRSPVIKKVLCFSSSGKPVPVTFQPSEYSHTLLFQLPAGVYYLQVYTTERVYTASFITTPQ